MVGSHAGPHASPYSVPWDDWHARYYVEVNVLLVFSVSLCNTPWSSDEICGNLHKIGGSSLERARERLGTLHKRASSGALRLTSLHPPWFSTRQQETPLSIWGKDVIQSLEMTDKQEVSAACFFSSHSAIPSSLGVGKKSLGHPPWSSEEICGNLHKISKLSLERARARLGALHKRASSGASGLTSLDPPWFSTRKQETPPSIWGKDVVQSLEMTDTQDTVLK